MKKAGKNQILYTLLLIMLLSGCALPRIIVLDDPLTPEEHINLGVAYEKQNEFEAAINEYKTAAKYLPVAYLYLGNTYFNKGDFNEAEFHYKKSIEKLPMNSDAYNNLAWLYYTRKKDLEDAERLAMKAVEIDPSKEALYMDTLEKIRALRK